MEMARIVGFRAHPEFSTLIQTVYECGHVYSQELRRFVIPKETQIRCAKCLTGMPAEVSGEEFAAVCHHDLLEHPLIGRLVRSLLFHVGHSEKRHYLGEGRHEELAAAIDEARSLLEEIGLGFDPMSSAQNGERLSDLAPEAGKPRRDSGPGYYYELPDLSII